MGSLSLRRRAGFLLVAILSLGAGAVTGFAETSAFGLSRNESGTLATVADISYRTRHRAEGAATLRIRPIDRQWEPYMAANAARLREWQRASLAQNYLTGQYVKISFVRPVSLGEFEAVLQPLLDGDGQVDSHIAVAKVNGRWGEEHVSGPPSARSFDENVVPLDGTRETRYTIDGIMAAGVLLGNSVTPQTLLSVDDMELVYFLDTTPIVAAHEATVDVVSYAVASPYYLRLE
jgi:hypothetical protein